MPHPKLNRIALLLALTSPLSVIVSAMAEGESRFRFDFGPLRVASGTKGVTAQTNYTADRGYGFEPGQFVTMVDRGGDDALSDDYATSNRPFLFSVRLPEGNYRVNLLLGDRLDASDTTVKAESRRLMLESVRTRPGETAVRTFIVNVRTDRLTPPPKNAPGGDRVRLNEREQGGLHWDDKLTLEFNGPRPCVQALEIEPAPDVPTVFLAGDSTVTDQPFEPGASWGQMLPRFLSSGIAVANHAESGETLKSFITGLRLDKLLSAMKAGDTLFIQFGHNDQKEQWPQTFVDPQLTYPAYLKVFIAEARLRGATPILVTSMHRQRLDAQGRVVDTLAGYTEAVRQVARAQGVALIDLHALSRRIYEALGPQRLAAAFVDGTHHSSYGAYLLAAAIAEEVGKTGLSLTADLAPDIRPFDPDRPPAPESFKLPASEAWSLQPPRGN